MKFIVSSSALQSHLQAIGVSSIQKHVTHFGMFPLRIEV